VLAKRTFALVCITAAASAIAACSSAGGVHVERASSQATSTAPPTTADPQAADKAAVLAAYQGYYTTLQGEWGMNGGQPHQNEQIADYASDAALDAAVNFIETLVQNHRTVRGPEPEHRAAVRCVSGLSAVVVDDVVDRTSTYEANGQQVASGPGSPGSPDEHLIALLKKRTSDNHWAVTEIGAKEKSCGA
jgi:hypothetical protein